MPKIKFLGKNLTNLEGSNGIFPRHSRLDITLSHKHQTVSPGYTFNLSFGHQQYFPPEDDDWATCWAFYVPNDDRWTSVTPWPYQVFRILSDVMWQVVITEKKESCHGVTVYFDLWKDEMTWSDWTVRDPHKKFGEDFRQVDSVPGWEKEQN